MSLVGDGVPDTLISDLSRDEALSILAAMNEEARAPQFAKSRTETSTDPSMTITDSRTATEDEVRADILTFTEKYDMDEVKIYMPKSEIPNPTNNVDHTRSLSTSETLQYLLGSNEGTHPRRNSAGQMVTSSIRRNRCSHHFGKIDDGEASGMWPAGKYKCTTCAMIISP